MSRLYCHQVSPDVLSTIKVYLMDKETTALDVIYYADQYVDYLEEKIEHLQQIYIRTDEEEKDLVFYQGSVDYMARLLDYVERIVANETDPQLPEHI